MHFDSNIPRTVICTNIFKKNVFNIIQNAKFFFSHQAKTSLVVHLFGELQKDTNIPTINPKSIPTHSSLYFYSVDQVDLELIMQPKLSSNWQHHSCLNLLNMKITVVISHAWVPHSPTFCVYASQRNKVTFHMPTVLTGQTCSILFVCSSQFTLPNNRKNCNVLFIILRQ